MADELQIAKAAQEAALATEGVLRLGVGRYVEAATYGANEKVTGVVVRPEQVEVHIVAGYPMAKSLPELGEKIRERVTPQAEGKKVEIIVEDVEVTEDVGI